jgi:hypothetical protein
MDFAQLELDKARKELDAASVSFTKAHSVLREVVTPPADAQRVFQIGEKLILVRHVSGPTAPPIVEVHTAEKIS